jgi:hypothetical protein
LRIVADETAPGSQFATYSTTSALRLESFRTESDRRWRCFCDHARLEMDRKPI